METDDFEPLDEPIAIESLVTNARKSVGYDAFRWRILRYGAPTIEEAMKRNFPQAKKSSSNILPAFDEPPEEIILLTQLPSSASQGDCEETIQEAIPFLRQGGVWVVQRLDLDSRRQAGLDRLHEAEAGLTLEPVVSNNTDFELWLSRASRLVIKNRQTIDVPMSTRKILEVRGIDSEEVNRRQCELLVWFFDNSGFNVSNMPSDKGPNLLINYPVSSLTIRHS